MINVCVCVFRDVSSVELLMNNHQGIKAEIDARNDSFTACIELGKTLLARKHYASEEVETPLCSSRQTVPSENPQKTLRNPCVATYLKMDELDFN